MSLDNKRRAIFFIFVLSGIGGLIYESIWSHYLKLFLGHAAYAQSLVLAIFMGGMGLGAWLAGKFSTRIKNLLLGYAAVELVIGLGALVFHRVFVGFTDFSYQTVLPSLSSAMAADLFRWSGSALLILPQSILLGMTFPLLSGGLIRMFPNTQGSVLSSLYFTNSLGAAIGVLLSGFVLIDAVGLPGTILSAGIINILVAVSIWAISKNLEPGEVIHAQPSLESAAGAASIYRKLLIVALLTGCASFVYEIVWIRMLSMVLGSSNHAFEVMLCAFVLGLAFGSLVIRRYIQRLKNARYTLAVIQVVMGLLAIGSLALYNSSMDFMHVVMQALAKTQQGYVGFNLASLAITIAIMFPAAFCAGMTLPLITHLLMEKGHGERSIGIVYAANTVGSIAGVILAVHVGLPLLGIKGALMMGAAIDIAAGIYLLPGAGERLQEQGQAARQWGRGALIAGSLACFALILVFVEPDTVKMASGIYRFGRFSSPDAKVLLHKDGKTTTVDVLSEYGILTLRTNGKTDASLETGGGDRTPDEYTQALLGALGLYHRPDAEYAANIGMGSGMSTHSILASPRLKEMQTIEIEQYMIEGAKLFGASSERTFNDPRSKLVIDDAKSFMAVSPRKYDLILSEPSNPWVSGVSSLFTQEFYHQIRAKLKPDGVFVQWLQLYQLDHDLVASVMKAMGSEFGDYVVYETSRGDLAILASPTKVPPASNDLFTFPNAVSLLKRINVNNANDLEMRRLGEKRTLKPYFDAFDIPLNSDYFPILDSRAVRDRFLDRTALSFAELHTYAIPVVDILQGRSPGSATLSGYDSSFSSPRLRDGVIGREMADYLRDGKLEGRRSLSGEFGFEMEHLRENWLQCTKASAGKARLGPLLRFAGFANPALSPSELSGVWAQFTQAPCYAWLTADQKKWLDLVAAVGARNPANMVQAARQLPQNWDPAKAPKGDYPQEVEYRQVALVVGLLATGRNDEAREAWKDIAAVNSTRFIITPVAVMLSTLVNGKQAAVKAD